MKPMSRAALLLLAGLLVGGPQATRGQGVFFVTGLATRAGGATLEAPGGSPVALTVGRSVTPGILRVEADARLMLLEPSGVVVVLLGPTTLAVTRDEIRNELQLELRDGKVMCTSSRADGDGRSITLSAVLSEQPRSAVELKVGPGHTAMVRAGTRVSVAYTGDKAAPAMSVNVNGTPVSLGSEHLLTVDGAGQPQVGPLDNWLRQQGFEEAWGRTLGVQSARHAREEVQSGLFQNIIAWDKYAAAAYVSVRLQETRFSLEIRQNVQTTTTPNRPSTRGAVTQTAAFPGANAVPIVSPAAASVQTIGQGVTAIRLNTNAAGLLAATGSQGLGFRGPALLAVPGFSSSGVRTAGPAGLGAQR
jgi:hypothetical protein